MMELQVQVGSYRMLHVLVHITYLSVCMCMGTAGSIGLWDTRVLGYGLYRLGTHDLG